MKTPYATHSSPAAVTAATPHSATSSTLTARGNADEGIAGSDCSDRPEGGGRKPQGAARRGDAGCDEGPREGAAQRAPDADRCGEEPGGRTGPRALGR